jgi:hypothetical protein
MKYYKQLLLQELRDDGWELLERNDDGEWWLEEAWKIRSVKQHWGYEVFIQRGKFNEKLRALADAIGRHRDTRSSNTSSHDEPGA